MWVLGIELAPPEEQPALNCLAISPPPALRCIQATGRVHTVLSWCWLPLRLCPISTCCAFASEALELGVELTFPAAPLPLLCSVLSGGGGSLSDDLSWGLLSHMPTTPF